MVIGAGGIEQAADLLARRAYAFRRPNDAWHDARDAGNADVLALS